MHSAIWSAGVVLLTTATWGREVSYCTETGVEKLTRTCRERLHGLLEAENNDDHTETCSLVQRFLSCPVPYCTLSNPLREEQLRYRTNYSAKPYDCMFHSATCSPTKIDECTSKISDMKYLSSTSTFDPLKIFRVFRSSCRIVDELESCIEGQASNCPESVQTGLDQKRRVVQHLQNTDCSDKCNNAETEVVIRQLVECHTLDTNPTRECSAEVLQCFDQVTRRYPDCTFFDVTLPDAMCSNLVSRAESSSGSLSLLLLAISSALALTSCTRSYCHQLLL